MTGATLRPTIIRAGLIGRGIGLSRSPAMHMAEGKALGLGYRYDLFDPDAMHGPEPPLADMLERARMAGLAGINITHPYKKAVVEHLDSLSDAARRVGAVNTVVFEAGRQGGHNTDFWGFAEGMRRGLPDAGLGTVLLLGAGGAGAAVAHALTSLGAGHLLIADTDAETARALAHRTGGEVCTDLTGAAAFADGIVNATPMGMAGFPGTAIDPTLLQPHHWVADIVYFPLETELLRQARARRCRVLNGSGMAVFQAVRAFELFTGLEPDADRMQATFAAWRDPVAKAEDR